MIFGALMQIAFHYMLYRSLGVQMEDTNSFRV